MVEQKGRPWRMRTHDLDGDGDDEVIVVNLRNARLDLYHWQDSPEDGSATAEQNAQSNKAHKVLPNELPMAPELKRTEVAMRQAPIDAAVADLEGDGAAEIYVLVSDPNRIVQLRWNAEKEEGGKWAPDQTWDLLPGGYAGNGDLLKIVPAHHDDAPAQAMVSTHDGIQHITLNEDGRAAWLKPRENRDRNDWWLMDLDRDGDDDLVEWTGETPQTLRWWPRAEDGSFKPAQPLHNRMVAAVVPLEHELLVLESSPPGLVRRYQLGEGKADAFGKRELLPLPGGADARWVIDRGHDMPVLVAVDKDTPRLLTFSHDATTGWSAGPDFATLGKLHAVAAAPAGGLLLWPTDSGDLYITHYKEGRYDFPKRMHLGSPQEKESPAPADDIPADDAPADEASAETSNQVADKKESGDEIPEQKIVGLGRAGDTVWCIQSSGDDLLLHQWLPTHSPDAPPQITRYPGAAGKADAARWMGDAGLLVNDKFARSLRHVTLDGETATSSSPSQLAKASLNDYRLIAEGKNLRPARLSHGVLQWLGNNLEANEQVMLPGSRGLADLIMTSSTTALALQSGGEALHNLEADDAGVLRVVQTRRIHDGRQLHLDPNLGLLLTTGRGVEQLSEGQPLELKVVQSVDARDGRPASSRNATVHRIASLDLTGDGHAEALLADDINHELIALQRPRDDSTDYTPLLAWQTFENQAYPYGGNHEEADAEPREVVALDLDGDGQRDLVMLSQDRIIFYLANQPAADLPVRP